MVCPPKPYIHMLHVVIPCGTLKWLIIAFDSIPILHSIPISCVIFAHLRHVFIDNSYHALLTFLHFPFFVPPTLAGVPQVPSSAIRRMQTGCSSPVPCRCRVKSPACRGWRWCPFTEFSLLLSTLSFPCPMSVLKNSWSTTIFTGSFYWIKGPIQTESKSKFKRT